MSAELAAVVDIGKSKLRIEIVTLDGATLLERHEVATPPVHAGKPATLDVEAIEAWIIARLAESPLSTRIRRLIPVAHGATLALLDANDGVLAVPDYEAAVFDDVTDEYRAQRDAFSHTLSPHLPLGLNLGRQLFWFQRVDRSTYDSATRALLHPQFWAWRFSGVMASEVTSLGCHSDLWCPATRQFSDLAVRRGWDRLFPPLVRADRALGPISDQFALTTGLHEECLVLCGLHDSNASYLAHRPNQHAAEQFAVVSSGTWTIVMAHGADLSRLDERRDMLANVDVFGSPVATARFMGGREFALIAGETAAVEFSRVDIEHVLARDSMAIPSFAPVAGPFAGMAGSLLRADALTAPQRAALATLYIVLMVDLLLDLLDVQGDVVVDGPLAKSALAMQALRTLRSSHRVIANESFDVAQSIAPLLTGTPVAKANAASDVRARIEGLEGYRRRWRASLPGGIYSDK